MDILDKERLKECRLKLGITKQEAVKRIQISQPAYLRYEAGSRNPSIQIISKMAEVFFNIYRLSYLENLQIQVRID